MSKQRIVKDEIWSDGWFFEQERDAKLVWLYLLTNEKNNVAGIYKLNREWASRNLNMKKEALDRILEQFQGDFRCILHKEWIILVNSYKHQSRSPKIKAGIQRILEDLPVDIQGIIRSDDRVCVEYRTLLNSTLLNSTLPNGEDLFDSAREKFAEKDMDMAKLLMKLIQQNYPDWQLRGRIETWAEHIEKLHRIDGRTYEQIEYMIRWTQQDPFWRKNILSTAKLREKFNQLIPQLREDMAKKQHTMQQASKPKMV